MGKDPVAALHAATAALDDGAGTTGLLDAVSVAAATRMLCHDLSHERRPQVTGYGWLDLTHSLTYCNAARWAWRMAPGPATARLAMYTVFHVVDSGRHASVLGADCATFLDGLAKDARTTTASLADALEQGQENAAVLAALTEPADLVAESLVRASLDDRAGALIVVAHHVKTARAAICEFAATGSRWPLAAAARFISAPAKQRFVTQDVSRARHFLTTGTPPPR